MEPISKFPRPPRDNGRPNEETVRFIQRSLAEFVKRIVLNPDEVEIRVETKPSNRSNPAQVSYLIITDTKDIGHVLGKQGKTIQALRTAYRAASGRHGFRCKIEVMEDGSKD